MTDDSIRRGVESYVAGFLRTNVAEALLSREGIRRSMKPEDLERLRKDVLDRLDSIEQAGVDDRPAIGRLVDGLVSRVLGSGTSVLAAMVQAFDVVSRRGNDPRDTRDTDGEDK